MKKYLALLLSLAFAVCLSACDRLCQWVYGGYHAYGVF